MLESTVEVVNTTLALCWWEEGLHLHGDKIQDKKIWEKTTAFKRHKGYLSCLFVCLGPSGQYCTDHQSQSSEWPSDAQNLLLVLTFLSHIRGWPEMRTDRPSCLLKVRGSYVYRGFALRYCWPFQADCCRAHRSLCVKNRPVWLKGNNPQKKVQAILWKGKPFTDRAQRYPNASGKESCYNFWVLMKLFRGSDWLTTSVYYCIIVVFLFAILV